MNLNTSDFESAMRFVIDATKKEGAPLLNKYALQTIIGAKGVQGAMALTPKAEKGKIKEITDAQISAFIANRLRRKGILKTTTSDQFREYCKEEKARRLSAAGYTAYIGWTPAAKAFGGTGAVGSGHTKLDETLFAKSEAANGRGVKATADRNIAEMVNTAPMAEELGEGPLQEALDLQAADMVNYANGRLQKIFNKVNG